MTTYMDWSTFVRSLNTNLEGLMSGYDLFIGGMDLTADFTYGASVLVLA